MAEFKRDFSGAKMNKDMDERVVPAGQYRDANNIQISTSDGSDVGSLQTLLGNSEVTDGVVPDDYSTCVGVMPLPEKDLIYYFVAGGGMKGYQPLVKKDYIIEYNTILKTTKYVFVDIYSVKTTQSLANTSNKYFTIPDGGSSTNTTGVRVGMHISGTFTNNTGGSITVRSATITNGSTYSIYISDNVLVTDVVYDTGNSRWKIYHDYLWDNGSSGAVLPIAASESIYFQSEFGERVLQFEALQKIHSINHLDGMIFWTDGISEPKKIHIERSILGTGGTTQALGWTDAQLGSHASNTGNTLASGVINAADAGGNANFHTRVVISTADLFGYETALNRQNVRPEWSTLENITVIKKSPKFPLELEMSTTSIDRTPDPTATTPEPTANLVYSQTGTSSGATATTKWTDNDDEPFEVDHFISGVYFSDPVDFRVGDVLIYCNDLTLPPQNFPEDNALVRVTVKDAPSGMPNNGGSVGPYDISVLSISSTVPDTDQNWMVRLEDKPTLFEFKFPRFSYRWKYQDGEYSCFAPWTEVAFLPGDFDYMAKKGYNLGMTNRLRSLKLKNYFHEFALIPKDVVQVDLLYKEEGSTNIYTVKEVKRKDGAPQWPDRASSNYNRGNYVLTSEMIHAVIPSNQLLRPWDNVPKSALTQEMSSNRLVYGNYKQNYDINADLKLDIDWSHIWHSRSFSDIEEPQKSCKTLRTYQIGVVFADEYGRETPVQVPKESSSITLDKKWSAYSNSLRARLNPSSPPPVWAKYMKYYVKETSNEYYNLAMDRWYDAEDGNVWLSFPSAERNKVDEETFLILKNEHDANKAVYETGRYKVIAISEDAPLFVKTEKKPHGSAATLDTTGGGLAVATNILVDDATFYAAFGSDFLTTTYPKIARGNAFARITASEGNDIAGSEFVGIVAIRVISGNISIKIDQAIGDTADQTDNFTSPTYSVQIIEHIVEPRPEFDGRFFVKVYKDLLLQQAVMREFEDSSSFTIIDTFNVGLITHPDKSEGLHPSANQSNHTYHRGGGEDDGWRNSNSYDFYDMTGSFGVSSGRMGDCDARTRTKQYWKWRTDTSGQRNNWYIDGAGHRVGDGWTTGSGFHNSYPGVSSTHMMQSSSPTTYGGGSSNSTYGCFQHFSDHSQLHLGFNGGWDRLDPADGDLGSTHSALRLHRAMRTAGTLFRFRADPTRTVYIVRNRRGERTAYNYHRYTTCKTCNTSKSHCQKRQMVIRFERLDGVIMPGPYFGVVDVATWDPLSANRPDGSTTTPIDILQQDLNIMAGGSIMSTEDPAIWETEPKEDIGLDIYYEASGSIPLDVTHRNNELLIPLYSTLQLTDSSGNLHVDDDAASDTFGEVINFTVTAVNQPSNGDLTNLTLSPALTSDLAIDRWIRINRYDGSKIVTYSGSTASDNDTIIQVVTGKQPYNTATPFAYQPWRAPHHQPLVLGFHNCWQFGNGIESDRVRDDYNAPQLRNGVKASTVLAEPYAEEHRSSGLIWSGIFNSTSGVNNLNQFIQAEPITKDLSPRHGTLQRLVGRDTNTIAFCEDKVLNLTTDKDAIYKADGNPQLIASNKVIGQATPIMGDYGISTNPESLAVTPHGMYWCDQMRGQVLSLEGNATIRSISDIGMKDYFNDNLQDISEIVGTYDDKKNEYNLTFGTKNWYQQFRSVKTTVSFNELTKGWVSFKSFGPEHGVSMNNEYYTWNEGSMWQHHTNATANNFYGTQYYSDVTLMFNDQPGAVKSFGTINYEGSQARITQFTTVSQGGVSYTDKEYYNLNAKTGWYTESIITDLQEVEDLEFKNKEGKWFSTIKGVATTLSNLDEREFSVQGLDTLASTTTDGTAETPYAIQVYPRATPTSGATWDASADSTDWTTTPDLTRTGVVGATIAAGYLDTIITNVTANSKGVLTYSGLNLDAANFSVPGGITTTTGSGNSTVYIYTADADTGEGNPWNADSTFSSGDTVSSGVSKVEFTNIGIANDPGNTVRARAYYPSFTMPASNYIKYYDVDHAATLSGGGKIYREACLHVTYQEDNGISVDKVAIVPQSPVTGITRTDNIPFVPNAQMSTDKWSGTVQQGVSTKIAEYIITADAGYHLVPRSNSKGIEPLWFTRAINTPWEPYYNFTVTDTYYTGNNSGMIESTKVKIYYTPPVGVSGLDPDPISGEGNFCSFIHDIRLNYSSQALVTRTSIGNKVTSLSLSSETALPSSQVTVTTGANAAGNAKLYFVKLNEAKGALTHYYDFVSETFDATGEGVPGTDHVKTITYTLGASQQVIIDMPSTSETATYSAYMAAGTGGTALTIDTASVADAINELNLLITPAVNATLTPGTLANTTAATVTAVSMPTKQQLTTPYNQDHPFSFTWTKNEGITSVALNRQPSSVLDITGAEKTYSLTGSEAIGQTTIEITSIIGIKTGMKVEDDDGQGRIPANTVVNTVNAADIVISNATTTASMAAGELIRISSDWEYEFINLAATATTSVVTVTGTLRVKKYGTASPNGNIIIQPNFITVTS